MEMQAAIAPEGVNSLALAMIASSNSPLLLLDGEARIVAASASFSHVFQLDAASLVGCPLAEVGKGEWALPQLGSLLAAAVGDTIDPIESYEMDLKRAGRESHCLLLNVRKLEYGDEENIRLLLAISDVTETRFNEKYTERLIEEKSVLLDELQHRVANSLQIIASVLMQSARRVAKGETRDQLYNAHHRVMSVASLQHHLATTRLGDVALGSYLRDLCESIAASMIQNPDRVSLIVQATKGVTGADDSMRLGLIVTELVINAIKHAFPGQRHGKIVVDYQVHGPAWVLSVADNGVGMPADPKSAVAGLGTSIVEALARQLNAEVSVSAGNPGTIVLVSCEDVVAHDSKAIGTV